MGDPVDTWFRRVRENWTWWALGAIGAAWLTVATTWRDGGVPAFVDDVQGGDGTALSVIVVALVGVATVLIVTFGQVRYRAGHEGGHADGFARGVTEGRTPLTALEAWYRGGAGRTLLATVPEGAIVVKWGPRAATAGGVTAAMGVRIHNVTPFPQRIYIESLKFREINNAFLLECNVSGARTADVDRGAYADADELHPLTAEQRNRVAAVLTLLHRESGPSGGDRVVGERRAFYGTLVARVRVGEPGAADTRSEDVSCETAVVVEIPIAGYESVGS